MSARPSYVDHQTIADAVDPGSVGVQEEVFDPFNEERHSELRDLFLCVV